MKYLLVIVVVGVVVWLLTAKSRTASGRGAAGGRGAGLPQAMVVCSHCGTHLPAADAVFDGSRVYCSDDHRALGPTKGR